MRNLVGAYCGVVAKWRCGNQNMPNLTADDEITAHRAENYGKLTMKRNFVDFVLKIAPIGGSKFGSA